MAVCSRERDRCHRPLINPMIAQFRNVMCGWPDVRHGIDLDHAEFLYALTILKDSLGGRVGHNWCVRDCLGWEGDWTFSLLAQP